MGSEKGILRVSGAAGYLHADESAPSRFYLSRITRDQRRNDEP